MSFNPFNTTRGDREIEYQETAGMVNEYEETVADLTRQRNDLKAKLAQVEADSKEYISKTDPLIDSLMEELATLRATAQRRLELLRKCEWPEPAYDSMCQVCGGLMPVKGHEKEGVGHKPDCPLAHELQEGK